MTADTTTALAVFAAVFCTLLAAHTFGDIWVQTHRQACGKGAPGKAGRIWCIRHVASLTITKLVALAALIGATGLDIAPGYLAVGLLVDAGSHYWADRRSTLQALAERLGKGEFYQVGAGHLGSSAHALDQSFHILFVFVASLILAGGA